ncbi:MAG: hypothetical protein WBF81_01930 [Thermoplasmata archaeon]
MQGENGKDKKYYVGMAEHPPNLCPHSSTTARKQLESLPESDEVAKRLGVERVFAGIPVPEHQTIMVFRAPSFEAARTVMVETGFVQTNTITIRQTESFEEFTRENQGSTLLSD